MSSTILICTANDSDQVRLGKLADEGKEIQRLLNGSPRKNYDVVLSPESSTDDIIQELNVQNRYVEILHYAGHSDGKSILLNDAEASADALAKKLQSIGTLKLVFINGCSSKGQVQFFHAAGIHFVIATSRAVDDDNAFWFAKQFYNYLTIGRSLQKSFEATKLDATFQKKNISFLNDRAIGHVADIQTDTIPWALYIREGAETQDYSLPAQQNKLSETPELNHTRFLDEIIFALASVSNDNPYLDNIRDLARKIGFADVQQGEKIPELLKVLPYPMGMRVRQITAEVDAENKTSEYYRDLLYDYAFLFETILHYASAILIAYIWQYKEKLLAKKPQDFSELIFFWQKNRLQHSPNDYKAHINQLMTWVKNAEIDLPFSMEDEKNLNNYLNSADFAAAALFFNQQKSLYDQNLRLFPTEVVEICFEAQDHLIKTFQALKIFAVFNMASMRGINVVNFRHVTTVYENIVSKLILADAVPKSIFSDKMLENKSVLWYNTTENKPNTILNIDKLNLFPFIIDRNVFTEKSNSEVDLYLFIGYFEDAGGTNQYNFVSVKNPSKIWQFNENQNQISLLHVGESASLAHQANHLMARAGEFKKYLSEFKTIFLNT